MPGNGLKISTITLTTLERPLRQSCSALDSQILSNESIEHIVVVDTKAADRRKHIVLGGCNHDHRVLVPSDDSLPQSRIARLASLRNLAIDAAHGQCVTFLDDDNSYKPQHLQKLVEVLETGYDAVHSWAEWVTPDGEPYYEEFVPFHLTRSEGMLSYRRRVAWGTLTPGDNTSRDISRNPEGGPGTVDMGEWMIRTDTIRAVRFREDHSEEDEAAIITEDDKLLIDLLSRDVSIGCSRSPTHIYRMGGFTNSRWWETRRN